MTELGALQAEFYTHEQNGNWDKFVRASATGTLLHSRAFLDYHGNRFLDRSIIIKRVLDGRIEALVPFAAVNGTTLNSHPGATYGGMVTSKGLLAEQAIDYFSLVHRFLRGEGYETLRYTLLPAAFRTEPSAADAYALTYLGGNLVRRQPNFILDPSQTKLGRRGNRKIARTAGVQIEDDAPLDAVFELIASELEIRHGTKPIHSFEEIRDLSCRLGSQMHVLAAHVSEQMVAGAIVFEFGSVLHTQYLGNSAAGREVQALDALVEWLYEQARSKNKWLSFGISSDATGLNLNSGLARFKEGYGARVDLIDTYEIAI